MKTVHIFFASLAFAVLLSCITAYRIVKPDDLIKEVGINDIEADLNNFDIDFEARSQHPDVGLRVPELVTKYGYPVESHTLQTSDGYLLTMHRIPHGKNNAGRKAKKVILLQHGLLCSSADWVLMGPEQGLAYLLAEKGYDVWMGNARGNTYSRKHIQWNADLDRKEFWNFSWHEIGTIDLPTMIDYILEKTAVQKIYYAGHSQGTTAFWVMGSEKPEYMDKIKVMCAMAPVAFMSNIPNEILKLISKMQGVLSWIMDMLGQFEFMPSTKFIQLIGNALCNDESFVKGFCSNILFIIAGYDKPQLNMTMLPVIISNTPAGASTKQILHYAQLIQSKEFNMYDYGSDQNKVVYGPEHNKPPKYDLSKVTAPVALFYGLNDALASEKDVLRLYESLPHVIKIYPNKFAKWSHLDFLWAIDVKEYLYKDIFNILDRY